MGLVPAVLICVAFLGFGDAAAADAARAGISATPSETVASPGAPQGPPAGTADAGDHAPDLVQTGTRLLSATLVVIGLLALGAYGVRRFMNHRGSLSRPGTVIRVVTTRSLGARSSLAVVEIGDERFVIGVSPQRISFLTALAAAGGGEGVAPAPSAFERELQKSRSRGRVDS